MGTQSHQVSVPGAPEGCRTQEVMVGSAQKGPLGLVCTLWPQASGTPHLATLLSLPCRTEEGGASRGAQHPPITAEPGLECHPGVECRLPNPSQGP